MNAAGVSLFGRILTSHTVLSVRDGPYNMHAFDDELMFNTQSSSQWDSLVHFAHQPSGKYYNGATPTTADLTQPYGASDVDHKFPTLNHWHDRGGLVGRGVLLDYRAYAAAHGITYSCFSTHKITIEDLEAVAAWEEVEFKKGDILLVRTGFTDDLSAADGAEKQQELIGSQESCGVEGSKRTARWFWDHHFAAVAGDTLGFEQLPSIPEEMREFGGPGEFMTT